MRRLKLTATLVSVLLAGCATTTPNTTNKIAHRINDVLPQYQRLAAEQWPQLSFKKTLKVGMRAQQVPEIRRRLVKLGDLQALKNQNHSLVFTKAMADAVKVFQWRHGLRKTGSVNKATLSALNVTPAQRYSKLMLNMQRWAKFPDNVGSHYIRVNIANFELDVVRDGKKVLNMKVIAGRPSRQTPTLYSKIKTMVFNPKWNVPRTIAQKDIVPKQLENPQYLTENNMSVYKNWRKNAVAIDPLTIDWQQAHEEGFQYRITQAPGAKNALGRVKFLFLNDHDVYLHDTPQKGLFNTVRRAYSSGCIRLEKPMKLVEYFIDNNKNLTEKSVTEKLTKGKVRYVKIKNPIPLIITYMTAWVDKKGFIHFRDDIYQRDY